MDWLSRHDAGDLTAVAIAPDLGERYLDTIYQTNWVEAIYGKDVLEQRRSTSRSRPSPDRLLIREVVMGSLAGTLTAEPATGAEGILAGMLADVMQDRAGARR